MNAAPLVLGWLIVAHLVADFLLQTNGMAIGKHGPWPRAFAPLVQHASVVAVCLVPFVLAFGIAGLWTVVAVAVLHGLVDAAKGRLTRGAEAAALHASHRAGDDAVAREGALGRGWTATPAVLFLLDQAVHLGILAGAWWVLLRGAALTSTYGDLVSRLTVDIAPADLHRLAVASIVGSSLLIVNVRAGAFFVALLLDPERSLAPEPAGRVGAAAPVSSPTAEPARGYSVRLGPLSGRLEPDVRPPAPQPRPAPSPRIGATIGILERLLIVMLMLGGAQIAIGLVVAAKTLARFKELDDRSFAEYYLLGTLASVGLAVISALVAGGALSAL